MRLKTNPVKMLLTLLLFIAVASYLTISLTTRDAIWFVTGFEDRPTLVIIYDGGKTKEYRAGTPGFEQLAEGVRATLEGGVARPSAMGLSEGSLEDALTMFLSVEAYFPKPVKLHTWFNTGNPTRALFPITGRHSDRSIVFLSTNKDAYNTTAPILKTREPLLAALRGLGYQITQ